ncbi:hypothetical protein [Desertibacillus haloalkaliphilus]|uniref:hypothetical protein n=1 Tax=Desertibacillus haloalkaliphilus TaxID=1328930 RepID=UPI001C266356|nr:hypothetical protein [Desertibacillus haloalkaliphilus]MBU8906745.1 hypothetical protein [Desertibacillus haloalkaliphilus]
MNKSDLLDELRLEVGQVLDYAQSLTEFYRGIVWTIGEHLTEGFAVGLYISHPPHFELCSSVGEVSPGRFERFGEGMLSISAIRSHLLVQETASRNCIISPFFEGHHLKGFFVIETPKMEYPLTEEDIIFVKEVTRFIEVHHIYYQNSCL